MSRQPTQGTDRIEEILGNRGLADSLRDSIGAALSRRDVCLGRERTISEVFESALRRSIRDIEAHPRGRLFRRLITHGVHDPDDPEALESDGATVLSDPEAGRCIEFIRSHMVNSFKGRLAELLALTPCCELLDELRTAGVVPEGTQLFFGDTIQQPEASPPAAATGSTSGAARYRSGADGLLLGFHASGDGCGDVTVHGVIEVKSMWPRMPRVFPQVEKHLARLSGGLRLEGRDWAPENPLRRHSHEPA